MAAVFAVVLLRKVAIIALPRACTVFDIRVAAGWKGIASAFNLMLNFNGRVECCRMSAVAASCGGTVKISREELYRRVWESPVTHIAKEFDISDVGLSKMCRRHAIPLPPMGYWTKLKHGKAVPKPPLPHRDGTGEIEIDARRFRVPSARHAPPDLPVPAAAVQLELPAEQLGRFTAATRKKLLAAKSGEEGFLYCRAPDLFECSISRGAIEAACRLLDAVEKALPELDSKLVKGEKSLEVEHAGQRVCFLLKEQYAREEHVVLDRHYKGSVSRDYSYTFKGKFSLEIQGYFDGRKKWADGIRESLSDKLGGFVQGLVIAARALKQRAADMETQRLKWAEEARLRAEREAEQRAVEDFRQKLLAEAQASNESELMLSYLTRIEVQLGGTVDQLEQPSREWLQLAKRVAQHVNPEPRRVQRLKDGVPVDSYMGYYGRTLL